jgi:hypothetical protein
MFSQKPPYSHKFWNNRVTQFVVERVSVAQKQQKVLTSAKYKKVIFRRDL